MSTYRTPFSEPRVVAWKPVPVVLFELVEDTGHTLDPAFNEIMFLCDTGRAISVDLLHCWFRGLSLARLAVVLQAGIDVEPPDSVIYVTQDLGKAWEYGGLPKLIVALDRDHLDRSYRELGTDSTEEEIAAVRARFPAVLRSEDGSKHWCSRLSQNDPRIASPYEVGYARWIPGDARAALRAALIFARPSDVPQVQKTIGRDPSL
jgi:hypothetical protein